LGPELALPLVRAPTSVAAAIIQLRNDELLEQWPTNEEVDAFVRSLSPSWILLTALNLESSLKTNLFPSADIPEDRLKEMIQASGLRDVTNQFIMPEDLERVKEAFVSTWVSLTPEDQALLTEEILTFGALIPGDAQAEAPAVESTDASSADPNVPTIALSKISAPSILNIWTNCPTAPRRRRPSIPRENTLLSLINDLKIARCPAKLVR
jgi:hypothetical protein